MQRVPLMIRVSADEKEVLKTLAVKERTNLSEYIREFLRAHLRERGVWPPRGDNNAAAN